MQPFTEDVITIGYSNLIKRYSLSVIPHYRASYIAKTGRGSTTIRNHQEIVIYSKTYALSNPDDPLKQLEFALKHDGLNLEIIAACFRVLSKKVVTDFVKKTPAGKYHRVIWFLYEYLTETLLTIPNVKNVPYVNILDPKKYYTVAPLKSSRHAVNNNLLGDNLFCPVVRKTELLAAFEDKDFSSTTQRLMNTVSASVLARATYYLFTKETKSSFGIEKVKPDIKRTTRFIALLETAASIEKLDKKCLLDLQNNIVESAYQDHDYRDSQNYVGELTRLYTQRIHYIAPKPTDLHSLMDHFLLCENKLLQSSVHPVVIAAILSFGFVFLHPFEDGNGRIHRFIIHYVLSKTHYTPRDMIFPVSAVMLKNNRQYDEVLELFSKPLLQAIERYHVSQDGILTVTSDTKSHYQFIDYTSFVEYLFECIEKTVQEDFQAELDFIVKYDKTKAAIQAIIDMPDLKIDRIIRCISENKGMLGTKIRKTVFKELPDATIRMIEKVVRKEMV